METIASLSFWQPRKKSRSAREASVAAVRISMTVEDLITGIVAESRRRRGGWGLMDLPCSCKARSQTPLVGHAQWEIHQPRSLRGNSRNTHDRKVLVQRPQSGLTLVAFQTEGRFARPLLRWRGIRRTSFLAHAAENGESTRGGWRRPSVANYQNASLFNRVTAYWGCARHSLSVPYTPVP